MKVVGAVFVLAGSLLAGCTSPGEDVAISHVHGLAFDHTNGGLFVATHHGLAKGQASGTGWSWSYVGDERFDLMGFSQDMSKPGVFYSSGHPNDPRAFGGVHLGLRRSLDGGQTWEQRSLKGQVDFHALTTLTSGEGHLAGFWQGAIKVSTDGGLTWADRPAPTPSVVALSAFSGTLWAGTTTGLFRSGDEGRNWTQVAQSSLAGVVSSIGATADGTVLLVGTGDGRTGGVLRSQDGGTTWQQPTTEALRNAPGQVLFASDASSGSHVFAALGDGAIYESTNGGAAWAKIR